MRPSQRASTWWARGPAQEPTPGTAQLGLIPCPPPAPWEAACNSSSHISTPARSHAGCTRLLLPTGRCTTFLSSMTHPGLEPLRPLPLCFFAFSGLCASGIFPCWMPATAHGPPPLALHSYFPAFCNHSLHDLESSADLSPHYLIASNCHPTASLLLGPGPSLYYWCPA